MSEIGEPCGYCGTPDDGETWCCRLRYENGMDDPRRMGSWFQAEQDATPSSGVTEGQTESGERIDRAARAALDTFHVPKHPLYGFDTTTEAYRELWRDVARAVLAAAQPPAPADEGKAKSGELDPALVERCAGAAYELEQLLGGTPWESVIRRNWAYQQDIYDRWIGIARAVLAAAQPPAPADEGFGEEYWRGHSVGRCEERERLEPSEDDNAALTDLIRNGLLGDDGLGAQHQRTDDGLPRDLARWIIDAGWRKPGAADAATVLAGLREEMQALRATHDADQTEAVDHWYVLTEAIALVEAAQRRLADRGHGGGSDG